MARAFVGLTIALSDEDALPGWLGETARRAADVVDRAAGPFLESLPGYPEGETLPELGAAVRVDRGK